MSGILLGFDDYSPDTWALHFPLFDKYNVRVTFFVQLEYPTPFCFDAEKAGHEIAYHTITHPHLQDLSKEEFLKETVSCAGNFREKGIALTTFAYPFGDCEEWMHGELLKYYKIVRGFRDFTLYKTFPLNGFIIASSIDNYFYKSERQFRIDVTKKLKTAKRKNAVIALTSHEIGSAEWGITPERLEWFLQTCTKLGLKFYTYKDVQVRILPLC